jgi:hypothetical protein
MDSSQSSPRLFRPCKVVREYRRHGEVEYDHRREIRRTLVYSSNVTADTITSLFQTVTSMFQRWSNGTLVSVPPSQYDAVTSRTLSPFCLYCPTPLGRRSTLLLAYSVTLAVAAAVLQHHPKPQWCAVW